MLFFLFSLLFTLVCLPVLLGLIAFAVYLLYFDATKAVGFERGASSSGDSKERSFLTSASREVDVPVAALASSAPSSEQPRASASLAGANAHSLTDAQCRELVRDMRDLDRGVPLRTRYFRLKKRKNTFSGTEAVDWLTQRLGAASRADSVLVGELLMFRGAFHNVSRLFPFADKSHLLYRFDKEVAPTSARKDSANSSDVTLPAARYPELIEQLRAGVPKREQRYRNRAWPQAFLGSDAVVFLQKALKLLQRDAATKLATDLMRRGAFHHVTYSEPFADKPVPFRFFRDEPEWSPTASNNSSDAAIAALLQQGQLSRIAEQQWDDSRDWKLFINAAPLVKYARNEAVLAEGTFNNRLFRVRTGSVRVEKKLTAGKPETKVLAVMDAHKSFGEMSVVDSLGTVSASIFANDDNTELYVMDVSFIQRLFESDQLLAERFYKNMAVRLARRLTALSSPASKDSSIAPAPVPALANSGLSGSSISGTDSLDSTFLGRSASQTLKESKEAAAAAAEGGVSAKDAHFQREFSLDKDEVVYKEFGGVKWRKNIVYSGTLYVSPRYVAYGAKVFGFRVKRLLPLARIRSVERVTVHSDKEAELRLIATRKHKSGSSKNASGVPPTTSPSKAEQLVLSKDSSSSSSSTRSYAFRFHSLAACEEAEKAIDSFLQRARDGGVGSSGVWKEHSADDESRFESDSLSHEDWDALLREAKLIKFSPREVIVQEGDFFQRIFQVSAGRCRVEKKGAANPLGFLGEQEMFGEISFLQGEGATASVVADEEPTEVYVIEGFSVSKLFQERSGFAPRFFKYLASVLNARIRAREESSMAK